MISSPLWYSLSLQPKAPKTNHITSRQKRKALRSDPITIDLPQLPERPKPNRDRYTIPRPRCVHHLGHKLLRREPHRWDTTVRPRTLVHWFGAGANGRRGSGTESTSRVVKRRRRARAGARDECATVDQRGGRGGGRVGTGRLPVWEWRATPCSGGRGHPAESTRCWLGPNECN